MSWVRRKRSQQARRTAWRRGCPHAYRKMRPRDYMRCDGDRNLQKSVLIWVVSGKHPKSSQVKSLPRARTCISIYDVSPHHGSPAASSIDSVSSPAVAIYCNTHPDPHTTHMSYLYRMMLPVCLAGRLGHPTIQRRRTGSQSKHVHVKHIVIETRCRIAAAPLMPNLVCESLSLGSGGLSRDLSQWDVMSARRAKGLGGEEMRRFEREGEGSCGDSSLTAAAPLE